MILKEVKTVFCTGLVALSFVGFFVYQVAFCGEAVSLKDGLLSVNLVDTSLLQVARDIEKQSGVWFRGDETLLKEKISVTFNDLPLEEGLKRILINLNYSLMFDTKNKVAGVMVMGEGTPAGTQPARPGAAPPRVTTPPRTTTRPVPAVRSRPIPTPPPAETVRRSPRVLPQPAQGGTASQASGSSTAKSALPDAFNTQENAPPPGGPVASDGPLPTHQGTAANPGDSKPPASAPSPRDTTNSDTPP